MVVPPRLILASASPRRADLLRSAGFAFSVALSTLPESETRALTLPELTLLNATRKTLEIAHAHPDAVVLGADTLVALEGEPIGKPRNLKHAYSILRRLSGRTHLVCSAVHLTHLGQGQVLAFHEMSQVTFRRLTDEVIADYFLLINPLDKAGAYAAQDEGGKIIRRIEGSFSNIVGLPMEKTVPALRRFGLRPRT